MKRGEIWTVAGGGDYSGKARPAVILQDDRFDALESVTICLFTSQETEASLTRISVEPTAENGLEARSQLMAEKITTVRRGRLGSCLGRLGEEDRRRLDRAVLVFLGFAGAPPESAEMEEQTGG